MNKKFALSKVTIVMLLLLVIVLAYVFIYFIPAQSELTMMRSELSLYTAESAVYRQYLEDTTPLEEDIKTIQAEIDKLNSEAYTNDSTVSFEISDAIQRYKISLSSVSLESVTIFEDYRVLPITLTMTGELENILKFIEHFENDEDGSYLVRGSVVEVSGNTTSASMVIYLCTPNV